MEIKIYNNIEAFEDSYMIDFSNQNEYSYLEYLNTLHIGYDKFLYNYFKETIQRLNLINEEFKNEIDLETFEKTKTYTTNIINSVVSNIGEILKFIQLEKQNIKTTLKLNSTKNKNSETEEILKSTLSTPQKIKILDKLNFSGFMQGKGYSHFQIAQLLSDIFERSEKSIRNNLKANTHAENAENYLKDLKLLKANRT